MFVLFFVLQVKFTLSGQQLHNFIRGLDSSPGAWTCISLEEPNESTAWQEIRLYGSQLFKEASVPSGRPIYFQGNNKAGIQWDNGLLIPGQDGNWVKIILVNKIRCLIHVIRLI